MAAFNNNPLPTPPQTPDSQAPVAIMLHTLANAIPSMDAEVAHAVATNSQSPDQAVQTGQAAQSFQITSQQVQALQDQSSANQNAVWKTMTGTQQAALKSAGYKPPGGRKSVLGSIFGGFHAPKSLNPFSDLKTVAGDVVHAVGTPFRAADQAAMGVLPGGLTHDTLNALGAPLRAIQHNYRTAEVIEGHDSFSDMLGRITSPEAWAQAYRETSNGEHYIAPNVVQKVQKQYNANTFALAYKLATGETMDDIVKATDPAQQQQVAQQIQTDPNIHTAVQELQAGKVSPGRDLANGLGLNPVTHKTLFNTVSGLTDATFDWFGDPTVIGAKTGAAIKASKYIVRTAEDVHWLAQNDDSVKAAMGFIAGKVGEGDAAGIQQAYPKLSPLIPDMMESGTDTAEKVENFFADNVHLENLIKYSPGSLPGVAQGGWMPTLSTAGQLRLAAKGKLTNAIDFMADRQATIDGLKAGDVVDHPLNNGLVTKLTTRPITGVGQLIRKLTTLTPPKSFDAYDPHWFNNLRNIAMMALPKARVNQILNDFAGVADIGAKRTLYVNLMKEIYGSMGMGDTEMGREWLRNFNENSLEHPASLQKYSTSGADMVQMNGQMVPEALDENGLVTAWHVPDYRTIYAQAKKLGITHAVMGIPNAGFIDKAMQQVWKPLALARIGFAFRVAGEEAFGHLLRNGPLNYIKARTALSLLKPGDQLRPNSPIMNKWGQLWGMLTDHLSNTKAIKTPSDLIAANLGDATHRAMKGVEGASGLGKYTDAIKLGNKYGIFDEPFAEHISAAHGHGGGYIDGDMLGKHMDVMYQGKMVPATLSPSGAFKGYENTNQLFSSMWYRQLKEIASSQWDRKALETADDPLPDRIKAVADALEKSPKMASRSVRYHQTADERRVGEDVTQRQAFEDWAANLINHVDSVTRKPLGDHIDFNGKRLVDHLLDDRKPPTVADLDATDMADRPVSVKGPDVVPVLRGGTGFFTRAVNRAFDTIGRQINWISRQPMYLHHFSESLDAYRPQVEMWKRAGMSDEAAEERLVMAAKDRAIEQTIPYVHNPELRSQFAQITRNLAPFWFAQEQFYKRWARTFKYSPWAFRQAQLINQGVAHSGFTHTDPTTGAEYFIYPGANVVQDVLTRSLGVFGYKSWLPINAALRGQVNQASPGLERLGLPSFGPLMVVPLNLVKKAFPELTSPISSIEGQQAANSSFTQSLVPTTVTRIWQDINSSPNNSAQYASAMMQAIQYLEATGHGIGAVATTEVGSSQDTGTPKMSTKNLKPGDYVTNADGQWVVQGDGQWRRNDPAALATYQARVKNWTRVFLITRTIFGFSGPASPENLFDPGHVNEDLQGLLKTLPFNDAVATFVKEHPDASAYTVFQTTTKGGGTLPATADAMAFMDANKGFFNAHPLAGAYFLPQVDTSGKFDLKAYQTQLAEGLRLRKTPSEFWQEILYNTAANDYFNAEDRKNLMTAASSGGQKRAIENAWTQQSQQFQQANPLFAAQLGTTPQTPGGLLGGSTTYTRENLMADLYKALQDPRLPENQQTEDIRTLYNSYAAYQGIITPSTAQGATSLSSQQKNAIDLEYAQQVSAWVAQHPDVQGLYNRLVRPEISTALNEMAQAQAQ